MNKITLASVYLKRVCGGSYRYEEERETIEKVIEFAEIVVNKSVEMSLLKISEDVYAYNNEVQDIYKLTPNEFKTLKEITNESNNDEH